VNNTGDILTTEGGKITVELGGKSVGIIDFCFTQTGRGFFIFGNPRL